MTKASRLGWKRGDRSRAIKGERGKEEKRLRSIQSRKGKRKGEEKKREVEDNH